MISRVAFGVANEVGQRDGVSFLAGAAWHAGAVAAPCRTYGKAAIVQRLAATAWSPQAALGRRPGGSIF